MECSGAGTIAAARPTVWAALNDPATLSAGFPGLEVSVADAVAPERLVLTAEGEGATARAELRLDEDGGVTRLRYRIVAAYEPRPGELAEHDPGGALIDALVERLGIKPAEATVETPSVPSQEEIFAATTKAVRTGVADARALRQIPPRAWLALALAIAAVAVLAFAL
jgi:carbon monoxide dehydrogenase subunit G